jgi:3-oxo-5-alpha-steroid 4-dehydrogenase 1
MTADQIHILCYAWLGIAFIVHLTMFRITAPFGRHTTTSWGPSMNNKWGWFVMELPSLLIMCYYLYTCADSRSGYGWVLFACWILHYTNRTLIYPLRIKPTAKQIPVIIVGSAIFFNLVNAGLNGYYLTYLTPTQAVSINDPRFITGFVLFSTGLYINWRSDHILINLRKEGETDYKIPQGFLFRYISSPNLFGEIVEWSGFALMAWNLPAFTFMAWTIANLVPRAKNHHDWYLTRFNNYPKDRKRVFPFLY